MAADTTFYDQRAAGYAAAARDMDLRPLYARFLPQVRPGGLILDAGCGSGRDALAFRQAGFRVEAFDASPQMARQAALLLGQDVPVLCFEELAWQERFDAIWACASLLHVAPADLPDALRRLQRALRPGGVMFFNFKYGRGQRQSLDGRRFTDMDEAGVRDLLDALPELVCLDMRTGEDDRASELRERWVQVLVRRIPSPERQGVVAVADGGEPDRP